MSEALGMAKITQRRNLVSPYVSSDCRNNVHGSVTWLEVSLGFVGGVANQPDLRHASSPNRKPSIRSHLCTVSGTWNQRCDGEPEGFVQDVWIFAEKLLRALT